MVKAYKLQKLGNVLKTKKKEPFKEMELMTE